jgi:hypothetical protein
MHFRQKCRHAKWFELQRGRTGKMLARTKTETADPFGPAAFVASVAEGDMPSRYSLW